jgi:hypothetical protein
MVIITKKFTFQSYHLKDHEIILFFIRYHLRWKHIPFLFLSIKNVCRKLSKIIMNGRKYSFFHASGTWLFNYCTWSFWFGLGCPAKLISIRNNRNWNRNWFRNYPKQDVCFGCFGSRSKQGVSVFRLNRNKKKTTETNQKSVETLIISITYLICFNIG